MEAIEDRAAEFVQQLYGNGSGSGFGYGSGSGFGYGSGSDFGYGSGSGSGSGYGDGFGDGAGDGFGDGAGDGYGCGAGSGSGFGYDDIVRYNGWPVYDIDNVLTLICHVRGNTAKGYILMEDLSLRPCYIAKGGQYFAHGETLREAMAALQEKIFEDMPEDERIEQFVEAHQIDKSYPAMDFFNWHNRLTGSCEMGRKAFAERHDIDLGGSMTTLEFLQLTQNDYGRDTIGAVMAEYGISGMEDTGDHSR